MQKEALQMKQACEFSYINLIKLWFMYEPIIFRFSYGEFNRERILMNKYACPLWLNLWNILENEERFDYSVKIVQYLSQNRYLCINFQNLLAAKKTFE